jgi:hypothetical protein
MKEIELKKNYKMSPNNNMSFGLRHPGPPFVSYAHRLSWL